MPNALAETLGLLQAASAKHQRVTVAYSDGKDSRAAMALAKRNFPEVRAHFMYFVPGLACVDEALDAAERFWGIPPIEQYPHWMLRKHITNGIYCTNHISLDELPEWKLRDIYDLALAESKAALVITGAKRADSLWRRRNMANAGAYDDVLYPLAGWTKLDVVSYLNSQKIPVPKSSGGNATGIDLSTPSLLWLHDTHPEDFRKLCEWFPFAEAVVWRRRFHGVT